MTASIWLSVTTISGVTNKYKAVLHVSLLSCSLCPLWGMMRFLPHSLPLLTHWCALPLVPPPRARWEPWRPLGKPTSRPSSWSAMGPTGEWGSEGLNEWGLEWVLYSSISSPLPPLLTNRIAPESDIGPTNHNNVKPIVAPLTTSALNEISECAVVWSAATRHIYLTNPQS